MLSRYLERNRIKVVLPHIRGDILDLGCGYKPFYPYKPHNSIYIGVDRNEKLISFLANKYPEATFLHIDINTNELNLPYRFDTILMMAVIEHLYNPKNVLEKLKKLLKSNGRIIITSPTPFGNILHSIGAWLGLFSSIAAQEHISIFGKRKLDIIIHELGYRLTYYQKFLYNGNQIAILSLEDDFSI